MQIKLIFMDFFLKIFSTIYYTAVVGSVYVMTGKATDVGLVSFAMLIPALFIGVFSGTLYKNNLLFNNLLFSCIVKSFVFIFVSFYSHSFVAIFIAMFMVGLIEQFLRVSKTTLDALLVAKSERMIFNSKKTLLNNMALVSGPALGGLMAAYFSFSTVLLLLSVLSLLPILFLYGLNPTQYNVTLVPEQEPKTINFIKSFRLIFVQKDVLTLLVAYSSVVVILEMQTPLIFPFVHEQFLGGAKMAGIFFSIAGFGGILGSLLFMKVKVKNEVKAIVFFFILDAFLFLAFTYSKYIVLSMVIFAFLGIVGAVTTILVETRVQNELSENLRPFAFSVMHFSGGAFGGCAAVLAGMFADVIGAVKVLQYSAYIEFFLALALLIFVWNSLQSKTSKQT